MSSEALSGKALEVYEAKQAAIWMQEQSNGETTAEMEKNLAKRVIAKTKNDLDDIFERLLKLRYLLRSCDYYDTDVISTEESIEAKLAMTLLYLDSMGNLAKDLEAGDSK